MTAGVYWHVVFADAEPGAGGWLRRVLVRLLAPGFGHVFACRPLLEVDPEGGCWLVVDAREGRVVLTLSGAAHAAAAGLGQAAAEDAALRAAGFPHYGAFVAHLAETGRCRVLTVPARDRERWTPRPGVSCVEAMKHLLGLPGWYGVWTPRQLYRRLSREISGQLSGEMPR